MAAWRQSASFLLGVLPGALVGAELEQQLAALAETAVTAQWLSRGHQALAILQDNLRGAVLPFVILLLAYTVSLLRLHRVLRSENPGVEDALRSEQIVDPCAGLFFGVGVI